MARQVAASSTAQFPALRYLDLIGRRISAIRKDTDLLQAMKLIVSAVAAEERAP